MTFPKENESIIIDNTEFVVESISATGALWLKEANTPSNYYSLQLMTKENFTELHNKGKIVYGKLGVALKGGSKYCAHDWKRYVGATSIDDYCHCGARKVVDWKELK